MTAKRFTLEWYAQKYQELAEENEQLKRKMEKVYNSLVDENEQLKKIVNKQQVEIDYLAHLNSEFKEENKELKSLCKVLIKHIDEKSIAFVIDEDIRRLLK